MPMKSAKKVYLSLSIFLLMCHCAYGQKNNKGPLLKGDFGLYGDFYQMNSDTIGAVAPRRPDFLGRLVINLSLDIKDFSLPISMALPTGQYGVVLPSVPKIPNAPFLNFKEMVKNPLNRIGLAPKYKWFQVLLGSQIPQYSDLSVGDLAVFGAGLNLTPGKFRFSCFAGTSQLAVQSDSTKKFQGIYARKIISTKIGFGHEDSSHIYLIGSMMKDDTTSIRQDVLNPMPQTGILSSLDFRLNFTRKFYMRAEIAASAFTRDVRSNDLPSFSPSLPEKIFKPKESSRADFASQMSIGREGKNFGIKITGRYYGDGFVALGYPFMQTDRLEVTVDPRLILFKNKVQFSGSVGRRVNNLSEIRATTTTQTLGSANLNLQFSDHFSLAGSYSNFGFRNSILNDTFRVEMVSASWSVSPSINFSSKSSLHNFTILYSQNAFKDYNTVSGAVNDNDASNAALSYMISLLKSPFSISTIVSYFENTISFGTLTTKSVNLGVGYKFFKKKLGTTAGFTLADNTLNGNSAGSQVMALLGIKYTVKKKIAFGVNGSMNLFEFGESRPGISYTENLLRTSVTYKL